MSYLVTSIFFWPVACLALFFTPTFVTATENTQYINESDDLEIIQITATKRQEPILKTPVAVTLIEGENLAKYQTNNISQLSDTIVNFNVGDGIVTTNVNMRGMGAGGDRSFEQSVGLFVDNVYLPRSRQYRAPFFDVERVEILHGPQAVLYGINSTAGALAVSSNTTTPNDDAVIKLATSYEVEHHTKQFSLISAMPVNETFALRLAAKTSHGDNSVQNLYEDSPTNKIDDDLLRLSAVWLAHEDISITAKYEYADFESQGYQGELFAEQGLAGKHGEDGELNYRNNVDHALLGSYEKLDYQPGLFQHSTNLMLNVDWQPNDYLVNLSIAQNELDYQFAVDLDTSPLSIYDSAVDETYQQTSMSLSLTSPNKQTFNYTLGAYFQQSELINQLDSGFNIETSLPLLSGGQLSCEQFGLCEAAEYGGSFYQIDQTMASLFAQLNWQFTEKLSLETGLRYVDESKALTRIDDCELYQINNGEFISDGFLTCPSFSANVNPLLLDRDSSNWLPEFILQYQLSDETFTYFKTSKSAKSGGYASASSATLDSIEYDDEYATTVELGYKSYLVESNVQLLLALFTTKYEDLQVNSFIDVINDQGIAEPKAAIRNAGSATNSGIELSFYWTVNDFVTLGSNLAFLDAKYDDFTLGSCAPSSLEGQQGIAQCDQSGQTLPYSPKTSAVIFADIIYPMFDSANLTAGINTSYSDAYYTDATHDKIALQSASTTLSAYIGIVDKDDNWQIELFANNITNNTRLAVTQYALGSYIGYASSPRMIGLQASYQFSL